MSHPQQQEFIQLVKTKYPKYFSNRKVLEVGSLNINGTVRDFFNDCNYLGIDVANGPGVDLVCQGQHYSASDKSYDVVISCECFEHNPYWIETFKNMHRLTIPDGLIIMTCATTGRAEHGTTKTRPVDSPLTVQIGWGDYYKNLTVEDFENNFRLKEMFSYYELYADYRHCDLYFYGIKC